MKPTMKDWGHDAPSREKGLLCPGLTEPCKTNSCSPLFGPFSRAPSARHPPRLPHCASPPRCPPPTSALWRGVGMGGGRMLGIMRRWAELFLKSVCAGGGGDPGAPTDRGRSNTDTQNAGATLGGTRASTAYKEERHSEAGEATRTAGTGNQNGRDGRACAWEAAIIKGMAWPASPVATGCQGNPCSTGIRWGVSPAAQMGCLRNRSGSPSGADQP